MRNLAEYPITREEMVETLTRLATEESERDPPRIGDMTGLVLMEAATTIDRMAAENGRLREAMSEAAETVKRGWAMTHSRHVAYGLSSLATTILNLKLKAISGDRK